MWPALYSLQSRAVGAHSGLEDVTVPVYRRGSEAQSGMLICLSLRKQSRVTRLPSAQSFGSWVSPGLHLRSPLLHAEPLGQAGWSAWLPAPVH